jgi:hypothetical protein
MELFEFYGNALTVQPGLFMLPLFLREGIGRNPSGEMKEEINAVTLALNG